MFSGFSNQVNSWMGAVKGEPHDEEVPTPTAQQTAEAEAAAAAVAEASANSAAQPLAADSEAAAAAGGADGVPQAQSPTKAGGMFSGMKTQMSGWLGNAAIPTMPSMPAMPAMPAIPSMPTIPGLRKAGPTATDDAAAAAAAGDEAGLQADGLETAGDAAADEEDRSSATEGADSAQASGQGTPSEEKVGQVEMVTTKVTQGAKTFGSFLYSAANKAGSKIKESVKSNPILGEFNKEQDAFIRGQPGSDAAVAPWIGHPNEEQVKEEILGLSADRRNFVRAPPAGVEFEFNYDVSYPIAVAIMSEDAALEKMRFELVPKIITEENFWRNYFYRVSLICQASDADAYGAGAAVDNNEVRPSTAETASSVPGAIVTTAPSTILGETSVAALDKRTTSETEFVSDTFRSTETDLEEVKAGMKLLGIDTLARQSEKSEEHWENQLESELQDFELVDGAGSGDQQTAAGDDANWENDVRDLLGDDCEDLK